MKKVWYPFFIKLTIFSECKKGFKELVNMKCRRTLLNRMRLYIVLIPKAMRNTSRNSNFFTGTYDLFLPINQEMKVPGNNLCRGFLFRMNMNRLSHVRFRIERFNFQ